MKETETRSAAVSISAASRYVFAATRPPARSRCSGPTQNLIAKIPLKNISGPVNPRQVLVTPDGTRAYVALWSSSAIAVLDTIALQEVDVNPGTPALDRINLLGGRRAVLADYRSGRPAPLRFRRGLA